MKLSELEKLAKKATLGQWIANSNGAIRTVSGDESTRGRERWQGIFRQQDAEFIAAANPTNILTLCATFREMLEAMRRQATVLELHGVQPTPFLLHIIKKAEEML